jgi:hypothetical protein
MENNYPKTLTLRKYFGYVKFITKYRIKTPGIIFTLICTSIRSKEIFVTSDSIATTLKEFIICILVGNTLALLSCIFVATVAFVKIKSIVSLFYSIPKGIKEKFGLTIVVDKVNLPYKYIELRIIGIKSKAPMIYFRYLTQAIQIIIVNNINNNEDFHKYKLNIDKRYKRQKISLTGLGLGKIIGHKKWRKLTSSEIENCINELLSTSEKEGLEVIKNK